MAQPDIIDDFRLGHEHAHHIADILVTDGIVIRSWGRIMYRFTTVALTTVEIERLLGKGEIYAAIIRSLTAWISSGANSELTFGKLVSKFEDDFQAVVDKLKEKKTQLQLVKLKSSEEIHECANIPKRRKCDPLRRKWWPEDFHHELIDSFLERKTPSGELLVNHIHGNLTGPPNKSVLTSQKQVIVGMGGVGKTSTAKWYANSYGDKYDYIVWLDSEGSSTLTNSFTRLARKLGLLPQDPEVTFEELVQEVYDRFHGFRVLFIFDNAKCFSGENGIKSVLPKYADEVHHVVITSRTHEWGNLFQFGQIHTFQLDVFSSAECVQFLSNTLKSIGKADREDEMVALGSELGFLPLALQCAVATITNSIRYNITNYLKTIRAQAKVVVDGKSVDEYERKIGFTLQLSIRQIEQSEEFGEGCRQLCKTILIMVAYCEPNNIPEVLFQQLGNIAQPLDQLCSYSLLTVELQGFQRKRVYGIHRLLQVVIRQEFLWERQYVITTIERTFAYMKEDFIEFYEHAKCAWIHASSQFKEILHTCHQFPYLVSLVDELNDDKSTPAFIKTTINNMLKEFQPHSPQIVQMKLRLIEYLARNKDGGEARREYENIPSVVNAADVSIPIQAQLKLHLRTVDAELRRLELRDREQDDEDDEQVAAWVRRCEELLTLYQEILEELALTGYNGVVGGVQLHHSQQADCHGMRMPLRLAVLLDFIATLCEGGQARKAIKVLRQEITSNSSDWDIECILAVHSLCHSDRKLLRAIIPDLFELLKSQLALRSTVPSSRAARIAGVARTRVNWLLKRKADDFDSDSAFDETLDVITFMSKVKWCPEDGRGIGEGVVRIVDRLLKTDNNAESAHVTSFLAPLECVWKTLTYAIKNGDAVVEEDEENAVECWINALCLNNTYSLVLIKAQSAAAEVHALDQAMLSILKENQNNIDWRTLHMHLHYTKNVWRMKDFVNILTTPAGDSSQNEQKLILQSKLKLLLQVVRFSSASKHDFTSLPSLIEMHDDVCYANLFLGQADRADIVWNESLQYIAGGPNAVTDITLGTLARFGRQTLSLLEGKPELHELARKFVASFGTCIDFVLENQRYSHLDFNATEVITLVRMLVKYEQYKSAVGLAARAVTFSGPVHVSNIDLASEHDEDKFQPLVKRYPDLAAISKVRSFYTESDDDSADGGDEKVYLQLATLIPELSKLLSKELSENDRQENAEVIVGNLLELLKHELDSGTGSYAYTSEEDEREYNQS